MADGIKENLLMALMQLQGHKNAGPSTDPNMETMVDALCEFQLVYNKDAADGAAGTETADTYLGEIQYKSELLECYVISADTLTADNTDYATITVEKADGAAGTQTTIAEQTTKITGSGDWAAATRVPITVVSDGEEEIAAGQVLSFKIAKAASGVAVPILALVLRLRLLEA